MLKYTATYITSRFSMHSILLILGIFDIILFISCYYVCNWWSGETISDIIIKNVGHMTSLILIPKSY